MANKITKREMFAEVVALAKANGRDDIVAFCEHETELLDRKAQNKKATKTQVENEGIKKVILATLTEIGSGTVSDIQKANAELGALSNQKVSSLIHQMTDTIKRETDGKRSIFSLV